MEKNKENKTFEVNGIISFDMVFVEGGTFWMGAQSSNPNGQNYDSKAKSDEGPVHQVTLSNYYIGKFEVTQALWQAVIPSLNRNNPNKKGDNYPVEKVSWNECQEFIKKLNQMTGETFALPTEAQWEFAARGGTKSKGYIYSGSNNIDAVAWYVNNRGMQHTHPVGQQLSNELGIYDMSGNVYEWCQDLYGSYSSGSQTNPQGPDSGSEYVRRGGGWCDGYKYSRVSNRRHQHKPHTSKPSSERNATGLRLVLLS